MEPKEIRNLLTLAAANFPAVQTKDLRPTAELWFRMLADLPYHVAEAAVVTVLAKAKFFPNVAEIREAAAALHLSNVPSPEEAWQEVLTQIRRVGSYGTPKWSHPYVEQAMKALYGSWGSLCRALNDTSQRADRAHFYRVYEALMEKERERILLPSSVRELKAQLSAPPESPKSLPNRLDNVKDDEPAAQEEDD